ncbi:MAG: hypothetical protein ACOCYO_03880 [Bacteroidota bacterium]
MNRTMTLMIDAHADDYWANEKIMQLLAKACSADITGFSLKTYVSHNQQSGHYKQVEI